MVRSNSILLFGSSDGTNSLLMKRPVDTLIVVFDLGTGISATAAIVDGEQGWALGKSKGGWRRAGEGQVGRLCGTLSREIT